MFRGECYRKSGDYADDDQYEQLHPSFLKELFHRYLLTGTELHSNSINLKVP